MFTRSWDNNDDVNNLRENPVAAKFHFFAQFSFHIPLCYRRWKAESWINNSLEVIWIRGLQTRMLYAATGHKGIFHEWKGVCVYHRGHLSYSQASLTHTLIHTSTHQHCSGGNCLNLKMKLLWKLEYANKDPTGINVLESAKFSFVLESTLLTTQRKSCSMDSSRAWRVLSWLLMQARRRKTRNSGK